VGGSSEEKCMSVKSKNNNEIILSKHIWLGQADAPVTVVEFGDYQSESCAKANEVIKRLLPLFKGKVRYNFRHFPLSQVHQYAMKAAEAAVAAAREGRFWEMHDILFQNRRKLGTISLKTYARDIGITDKRFLDNLVNSVYSWQVRDDLLEGLEKGVREVPTFFINDEKFLGEPNAKNLTLAVEKVLKKL
jgi:protein-disulfide isomerase